MNARVPAVRAAAPLLHVAAALLLAAALSGCAVGGPAELPPAGAGAPPAAAPAHTAAHTPAQPAAATSTQAPPSPEALSVLATIPEAVPGGDRSAPAAPAPRPAAPPAPAFVSSSAFDTVTVAKPVPSDTVHAPAESAGAPSDSASVPVPEPTKPLGAAPALQPTPEPPAAAPPAAPVVTPPAAPAAPAVVDDGACWRLQVGAPAERARGSMLRNASQSLLLVPMSVLHEAGRWKVRSTECYSRAAAESLRERATASGFKGVFLVRFAAGK